MSRKIFVALMRVTPAAIVFACVAVAGCGETASQSSSGPAKKVSAVAPAKGCGSYAKPAALDPGGVLDALPPGIKSRYAGYSHTVRKSAWSNWKPTHKPPYDVTIVWGPLLNEYQTTTSTTLKKRLEANPDIGNVVLSTTSGIDIAQQLQQIDAAVRAKPDVIIVEAVQPNAMVRAVDRAAKAGIPVITASDSLPSKYAVNVFYNAYKSSADAASILARSLDGKGNALFLGGIPVVSIDVDAFNGFEAVLANCPNLKKAGTIYGGYSPALAKSETLKYLATHPAKVDTVFQTGIMAAGALSAFQTAGRPVPSVADLYPARGSIGYWNSNRDDYTGAGVGVAGPSYGATLADITLRMLDGQGPKVTDILGDPAIISEKNLGEWANDKWTLNTPGAAPGPAQALGTYGSFDPFFERPGPIGQL